MGEERERQKLREIERLREGDSTASSLWPLGSHLYRPNQDNFFYEVNWLETLIAYLRSSTFAIFYWLDASYRSCLYSRGEDFKRVWVIGVHLRILPTTMTILRCFPNEAILLYLDKCLMDEASWAQCRKKYLVLGKQFYKPRKVIDLARASFFPSIIKLILDLFFCAAFHFLFLVYFLNKPIVSYILVTKDKKVNWPLLIYSKINGVFNQK